MTFIFLKLKFKSANKTFYNTGKLKESGTTHWHSPNTGATDETGFTALPGGYHARNGTFSGIGENGFWWTANENNSTDAWIFSMYYDSKNLSRDGDDKGNGVSVRCVKD